MAFWNRAPLEDRIASAVTSALEKAAIQTPTGLMALPQGSTALTEQQVRALSVPAQAQVAQRLPRDPGDSAAFGPGVPLAPAAIDPLQPWGRPQPRRSEYDVSWNLKLGQRPNVPFDVLKAIADQCDVVRRCIDIRKYGIQQQDWDIALTEEATSQIMNDYSEKSPDKAKAIGAKHFQPQIRALKSFLEEPDPQNHLDWSEWIGNALEEHFVWDALSIYPIRTLGGQVIALRIIDGSTIKPLLDEYGNVPQSPYPAFQQILYGFPRGEFTASSAPDNEFLADQLFYRPRDVRSGSPYGNSATEKSLQAANLWMKRQRWLGAEYSDGVVGRADVYTDLTMNERDRQQREAQLNTTLSGNTAERQRYHLWPAGTKIEYAPQIQEKYKSDYDEFLIKQIGSKFGVMPSQLGIISPTYGFQGRAGSIPGEQDISETLGDQPLEEWIRDVVNAILRQYLGMPKELTLAFSGGGIDEDAQVKATTQQLQVFSGLKTLNDCRAENGEELYRFPEADIPMIVGGTPVYVPGSDVPPAQVGPDGKPLPPPKPPSQSNEVDPKPDPATETQKFVSFAEKRQGKAWRDFEFGSVPSSLAKALNSAGSRGDLTAVKVLAATVPKALAAASL